MTNETTSATQQTEFGIQRIYVKDLSFESPKSPDIFKQDWRPEVKFDLNTSHSQLDSTHFEVVLAVTVTAHMDKDAAFLVEIKQAGIFTISGVSPEQRESLLGSFCPNILFPYLRETVSDVVSRGTFPQLYLAPINFDAVYAEHVKQKTQPQQDKEVVTEH